MGTGVMFNGSTLAVTSSEFINNRASASQPFGGAVAMRNPFPGCAYTDSASACSAARIISSSFKRCSAAERGGGIYLGPYTSLQLLGCNFSSNTAAREGGAVLADRDACLRQMEQVIFSGNSAGMRAGGGIYLGPEADVVLTRSSFINNHADDGGAVLIDRDGCLRAMQDVNFTGNTAYKRGGALLFRAPACSKNQLQWHATLFNHNSAGGDGGAVYFIDVIELHINISQSALVNNTALGCTVGGLGDGGAMYFSMWASKVTLTGLKMTSNTATRTGGAISAIAVASNVTISNSTATGNRAGEASQPASMLQSEGGAVMATGRGARLVLQKVQMSSNSAGKGGAVSMSDGSGYFTAFDIDCASNTAWMAGGAVAVVGEKIVELVNTRFVGNKLLWSRTAAGGGFYCLWCHRVRIANSSFEQNQAAYGGGAALTLRDWPSTIEDSLFAGNTASSGAVQLLGQQQQPDEPLLDNDQTEITAFEQNSHGMQPGVQGCSIQAAGLSADNTTGDLTTYAGGGGIYITTAAAQVAISGSGFLNNTAPNGGSVLTEETAEACLQNNTNAVSQEHLSRSNSFRNPEEWSPSANTAASGPVLLTSAAGMGCGSIVSTVPLVIKEESCSTAVKAGRGSELRPVIFLLDGLGKRVHKNSVDSNLQVQVQILDADGRAMPDLLVLGNTTRAREGTATFPTLSVPANPNIPRYKLRFFSQSGLEVGVDECRGAAVVPASGFYQSHPRNPLIHRCMAASACARSPAALAAMAEWSYRQAHLTTSQLNQGDRSAAVPVPLYMEYMSNMCSPGYDGALCGSCQSGYGRLGGNSCGKCRSKAVNGFLYFLVTLVMMLIPALQVLLHSKNVKQRTKKIQRMAAAASSIRPSTQQTTAVLSHPPATAVTSNDASGGFPGTPGEQVADISVTYDQQQQTCHGRPQPPDAAPRMKADQAEGAAAIETAAGPPEGLTHQQEMSATEAAALQMQSAAFATVGTWSQRIFSVACVDDGDLADRAAHISSRTGSAAGFLTSATASSPAAAVGRCSAAGSDVALPGGVSLGVSGCSIPGHGASQQPPASSEATVAGRRSFKFWHPDVLTMMVSYMQLLGLLRLIRIKWPPYVRQLFIFMDFTSGVATWVSLACSLNDRPGMPRSIQRVIFLLLWPAIALAAAAVFWVVYAILKNRADPSSSLRRNQRVRHYMVLTSIAILYFLYTPTTREVISLFACQPVDSERQLIQVAPASRYENGTLLPEGQVSSDAALALVYTNANSSWPGQGFWTTDTEVACGSSVHLAVALGMGVPALLLFVLGLPVALWLLLRRFGCRKTEDGGRMLELPQLELQYGLMYDKYRYSCYFWECLVLLENCALTTLLVLLQPQAPELQVLMYMVIIFIEALLLTTIRPYACNLLGTLRLSSTCAIFTTLCAFVLIMVSSESGDQQQLNFVWVALLIIVNLSVLGLHVWACARELRRWLLSILDREGRGFLTSEDVPDQGTHQRAGNVVVVHTLGDA
eukprot:gene9586-9749_t